MHNDNGSTPTSNTPAGAKTIIGRIALSLAVFMAGFLMLGTLKTAEILADAPAVLAGAPISPMSRFDYSVNLANRGPVVSAVLSAATVFISLAPNAKPVPPEALVHVFIVRRVESALEDCAIIATITALLFYAWPTVARRFSRQRAQS